MALSFNLLPVIVKHPKGNKAASKALAKPVIKVIANNVNKV